MWLDDIIGFFAPMSAFKRKQARMALTVLSRAYEGAKTGRRTDGWVTAGTSANTEIASAAHRLRDRARDIIRNNPYGKKARRVFADNFIGDGITPEASTGSDRLNKQIMAAWSDWSQQCDADGNHDFTGLQGLVVRSLFESGECFVRFRDRFTADGLAVPFQLQVLEADFLDATRNNTLPGGGYINQGIEFDSQNRRVAYWMWPQHPGENMLMWPKLQSARIPADQILHIYEKDRPGQIRGVTSFASVVLRMRDLDDYDDAELWRKKIESCFAAFVVQNSGNEGPTLGTIAPTGLQDNGGQTPPKRVEAFRPGMIEYLKPGEDVRFGNPSSDANYTAYMRSQLHAIAAGLGITYEQLTGDLSQVNYSSLRAGLVEFRRTITTLRWQVFIPMFCVPVWRRFIERAYLAGLISRINYEASWTEPKFEMVDPLKDAQADLVLMRSGLLTYREAVRRHGYDPDKQIADIAATNKQFDELGIKLDMDPRYTAKSGVAQTPNQDGGNDANSSQNSTAA